jgi:hypothetical protein
MLDHRYVCPKCKTDLIPVVNDPYSSRGGAGHPSQLEWVVICPNDTCEQMFINAGDAEQK